MSKLNGMRLWRPPMQMPESSNSAAKTWLQRLQTSPLSVRLGFGLLLLLPALMLTGCAGTSTPPTNMPRNPEPPPSVLPDSPPTYLDDARRDISEWRKLLNDLTAKPAN